MQLLPLIAGLCCTYFICGLQVAVITEGFKIGQKATIHCKETNNTKNS